MTLAEIVDLISSDESIIRIQKSSYTAYMRTRNLPIHLMPLPHPVGQEDRQSFMNRCMSDPVMQREFPDPEQRTAVCTNQWEQAKS